MTITVYTFEDTEGAESTFITQNAAEAREHAREYDLLCYANEFEFADRELAWDFRKTSEEE